MGRCYKGQYFKKSIFTLMGLKVYLSGYLKTSHNQNLLLAEFNNEQTLYKVTDIKINNDNDIIFVIDKMTS